jgi:hypothetical protein
VATIRFSEAMLDGLLLRAHRATRPARDESWTGAASTRAQPPVETVDALRAAYELRRPSTTDAAASAAPRT